MRQLRNLHLLTRHCPCNLLPEPTFPKHEYRETLGPPCDVIDDVITMKKFLWHNLGRSFYFWGQIEAVFNISEFSKWPLFWVCDKLFYGKIYRKLNIPKRLPLAFPTFWAFDRRSSSDIDGEISISKFDLLCNLVMSSMTPWMCIYTNVVKISWYWCWGSLMISLLFF